MGFGARASLAAILGFAAAFVVACGSGGGGLLSRAQSSAIASKLDAISSAVRAHRCGRSAAASRRLAHVISRLPSNVDPKLVRNLGQGAVTVAQLAATDCRPQTSSTTPTVTSTTTTTQTQTVTTTTTTTTATPPPTTQQTTATQPPATTATNPGSTGTSNNTATGGGAPVGTITS